MIKKNIYIYKPKLLSDIINVRPIKRDQTIECFIIFCFYLTNINLIKNKK